MKLRTVFALAGLAGVLQGGAGVSGQTPRRGEKWVASWAASAHGPYPSGNPSAQPDLSQAFTPDGASDQTFRLIVKPDLWSATIRLRFSNAFGTQPLAIDGVFVGLQSSGGHIVAGTSTPVSFGGTPRLTIPAGGRQTSDPIALPFIKNPAEPLLSGRRLAVSFHVAGTSGPMTWHAKALTTSYLTPQRAGSHGGDAGDARFAFTTTSWYFLDAVEVLAADDTFVIACFGDSITDGTASTLNGDDRWPDVLSNRLHARYGRRFSVVNAGIGGNRIVGPATYSPASPVPGGPSAIERFDRDVASLAGVSAVIWLEGINDLGNGAKASEIIAGMRQVVAKGRALGLKMVGGTIVSSLGSATAHGTPAVDAERQAVNTFIRSEGAFDGVVDFDLATRDPISGRLQAAFVPNSTIGGAGDGLHPNRAGYLAMGNAVDLELFAALANSRRPQQEVRSLDKR